MTGYFAGWDERTLDLAIDRFTVGLEERENEALDRRAGHAELSEFEGALAAIHLACLTAVHSPPAELLSRLEREGRRRVALGASRPPGEPNRGEPNRGEPNPGEPNPGEPKSSKPRPLPSRGFAFTGWLVAAGLLLSFFVFGPDEPGDPRVRRATLVARAADLVRVDWTATDDPAAVGVRGDVVWSPELQEGYMRFENLAPNVASESQFQLWIFDPTRAGWEAKPIDGGVFDVPSSGEVIVPIDAKLAVREAALFAVTIEEPGGVVLSEREHLILTAAL